MTEFVTSIGAGERRTLCVVGDIDIATVDQLLTSARACLDDSTDSCEIDLAGVTFMDSSGLGALVRIRNLAHEQGKRVLLTNVPASVSRLFEVTGLAEIFGTGSGR
jgi:anti-anti-sigma factor